MLTPSQVSRSERGMECDSMRAFVVALVFTACDVAGRPRGEVAGPGIEITSEPAADPDGVRLDLPGVGTSTGGDLSTGEPGTSTGAADLGAVAADLGDAGTDTSSTGGEFTSTGEPGSTSTGEASTGTSSTGEPPAPDFCGDGACTGAETEPACWGAGFCPGDCLKQEKCLSDCPCAPGITTFCNLAPGVCSATKPGGYCDPNGDGAYFDGDFTKGNMEHSAKCG